MGGNDAGVKDIQRLLDLAEAYGIKNWLSFDASVVRGLSYYTGIVFEGFDRSGEPRAICGGGRYDQLLETMGGESVAAVGFGFGDAVIVELLKMKGLIPNTSKNNVNALVFAFNRDLQAKSISAASALRAAGLSADLVLGEKKTKWVFQRADKVGACA